MTNLIYRGARHHGQATDRPRVAQALIYRGVPHDSRRAEASAPSPRVAMRYRGAAYILGAGALRPDMATAKDAAGWATPVPACE